MPNGQPPRQRAGAEPVDADEYRDAIDRELSLVKIVQQPVALTWLLLVSNVLIWLCAWLWGNTLGIVTPYFNNEQLTLYTGMKVNALLEAGQWWRLVSSQFVHLDIMHMVFNGYGLYILGPLIERFYGWRRFLLLYLASGTAGAVASFLFTEMPSGGASGAIYGLVGALVVFGYKYRDELPERVSRSLTTGMLPWVVLSLGIGFLESMPMDNAAHLGGLACGGLGVLVMRSRLGQRKESITDRFLWVGVAIAVAALVWTAAMWGQEFAGCATDGRQAYYQCYPELEQKLE